ncbi:hypothetical protein [Sulfurimonas sp.]
MNIFIRENDSKDIFDTLSEKLDTEKLKKDLKEVFKKVYNNYVGYYLFKDSGIVYKIFVLPKHIDLPQEGNQHQEQNAIRQLLGYFKIYYELKHKYDKLYTDGNKPLPSFYEIAFSSQNKESKAQDIQDIEEFAFTKYKYFLQEIKKFFDTHKTHKRVKTAYISQSVKYKLNLLANIKEPNKSKIHQEQYQDVIYSNIATIVYGAIKLFLQQKIEIVDKDRKLKKEANNLKNILLKKYKVDKSFSLSVHKLINSKTYKHFKKQKEYLALYSNVLALFGIENFFEEDDRKELNSNIKRDALFIKPDLMYEWYVYDWIIRKYCRAKKIFNIDFSIEKDEEQIYIKSKYNKKAYEIAELPKNKKVSSRSSEPDIVILGDGKKVIIDAKWKILEDLNSDDKASANPKGLSMSDVLKLQRDMLIHEANEAFLVFAGLPKGIDGREYGVSYFGEIDFRFKLVEIPIYL